MNSQIQKESLSSLQWVALILVVLTGIIHVFAGIVEGRVPVLLAGIGYGGSLALFALDYRRQLLYLVGIPYTFVQLPLWYVAKAGEYTPIGYFDKTVQVLLILSLASLYWRKKVR